MNQLLQEPIGPETAITPVLPVGRALAAVRPCVRGKFLFVGDEKLYVRGVTYGTFKPDSEGNEFHSRLRAQLDFTLMCTNGINAIRTYTVPPRWMLDLAAAHGLYVMVGIPWEQYIAFLEERQRASAIEDRVRAGVHACAGHPAVLCYVVGNEIPASIVRWHGRRKIERFLKCLYRAAKTEDPEGLVTYVNFPTTEYLQLPFVDFLSFNVYLESRERLESYLARLQNIAGERPLVMAEIGLDSRRNGEDEQAEALLEKKWPARYNCLGHVTWAGRLYGRGFTLCPRRVHVYHGTWGSWLFQSLYESGPSTLALLPLMPEWVFLNVALALVSAAGIVWKPLLIFLPLLLVSMGAPFCYVLKTVARVSFNGPPKSGFAGLGVRSLIALLHVLQPMARLYGRLQHGLTPWRQKDMQPLNLPGSRVHQFWSETWRSPEAWLCSIEAGLRSQKLEVARGGDFDSWDLLAQGGYLGSVRIRMAIEEHGAGRQLLRFRTRRACSRPAAILIAVLAALALVAALAGFGFAEATLSSAALLLSGLTCLECRDANAGLLHTFRDLSTSPAASTTGIRSLLELDTEKA